MMAVPIFAEGKLFSTQTHKYTNTNTNANKSSRVEPSRAKGEHKFNRETNKQIKIEQSLSSVLIVFDCWQYSLLCFSFRVISIYKIQCNRNTLCSCHFVCQKQKKLKKKTVGEPHSQLYVFYVQCSFSVIHCDRNLMTKTKHIHEKKTPNDTFSCTECLTYIYLDVFVLQKWF